MRSSSISSLVNNIESFCLRFRVDYKLFRVGRWVVGGNNLVIRLAKAGAGTELGKKASALEQSSFLTEIDSG